MRRLGLVFALALVSSVTAYSALDFAEDTSEEPPEGIQLARHERTFSEKRAILLEDVNREIADAKSEARALKQRMSDQTSENARHALRQLDEDIRSLEDQAFRLNDVTASTWYSVKMDTEKSLDRLRTSLASAQTHFN